MDPLEGDYSTVAAFKLQQADCIQLGREAIDELYKFSLFRLKCTVSRKLRFSDYGQNHTSVVFLSLRFAR